jgi:hypothetical protein
MPDDEPSALEGKTGHDDSNDDIGPSGAGPEDAGGSEQHREVSQNIVARADPRRSHVGIAAAIGPQQSERDRICRKGYDADRTHGDGFRSGAGIKVPDGNGQDPSSEEAHRNALGERRTGAMAQRHAHDEETDSIIRRITQEIECVGLERRRASVQTGADLDGEHLRIDRQNRPQHTAVCRVYLRPALIVMMTATGRAHGFVLHSRPDGDYKPSSR